MVFYSQGDALGYGLLPLRGALPVIAPFGACCQLLPPSGRVATKEQQVLFHLYGLCLNSGLLVLEFASEDNISQRCGDEDRRQCAEYHTEQHGE